MSGALLFNELTREAARTHDKSGAIVLPVGETDHLRVAVEQVAAAYLEFFAVTGGTTA